MEQTNNNQKETAADRYAYVNEGDTFRQLWQQAEQGDLKAQKEVAYRIYLYVQECTDPLADCETMIRYLKNIASHGDEHAMFVLGETYYCGYEGVGLGRQDLEESVRWFKWRQRKAMCRHKNGWQRLILKDISLTESRLQRVWLMRLHGYLKCQENVKLTIL